MEQELRQMFKDKESEMSVSSTIPPELRSRVGRHRLITGGLVAVAAIAVAVGGFAGARSLTSEEALPPAEKDSNADPFVDTWTTYVDGSTRTMVIRASGKDRYEITVHNDSALVCSGAAMTMSGTGRLFGSTLLVIRSPEITCDDGNEPDVGDDPAFREEVFDELEFEHDPEADILINYSPLENRRVARDGQVIFNGRTLVWGRADAESRVGEIDGWITYDDNQGIWARDLTNPDDPSDRVRLSSAPGSLVARSADGSKLLVQRHVKDPGVPPHCPACGAGAGFNETDLFVLNSDGTETRLTDPDEGVTAGASFSPDGTAVVYAGYGPEGGGSHSAIYVVDAQGGTPRLLLAPESRLYPDRPGPEGFGRFKTALQEPRWSPDGSQIAYFDGMGDWGHSLRVMDADGTNMRVVVENKETLEPGHIDGLQWSPDGSELAFSIEARLYVVQVDGSGFRFVTDDAVQPYWSPDGSHIAYARSDESFVEPGSLEIVRVDDLQVQNFGDGGSGPWTAEIGWSVDPQ